jgi:predicted patatin/cPLA2 family phospholipase
MQNANMTELSDIRPLELLALRRSDKSDRNHRRDPAHLALVLEGGGMRGVVSVAMAAALEELGYYEAFDSVHGASAGACNGAYFATRQAGIGTTVYYEDVNNKRFIDLMRWVRGRPIMDTDFLINKILRKRKPLDVGALINAPGLMHVVLTDIESLKSESISMFRDADDFFSVLKASICLPLVAGYHVKTRGRRYFDGGVLQRLAIQSAIDEGATHVIVLMTRPEDQLIKPPPRKLPSLDGLVLGLAYGPKVATIFEQRREIINDTIAKARSGFLEPGVRICSIARAAGATNVGRFTTNEAMLRAAADEGRAAILRAVGPDGSRLG